MMINCQLKRIVPIVLHVEFQIFATSTACVYMDWAMGVVQAGRQKSYSVRYEQDFTMKLNVTVMSNSTTTTI